MNMLIEVSVRADDVCDEMNEFSSSSKAEECFYRLARQRTKYPTQVVATVNGEWRMIYRIDNEYANNRWILSMDLETGLPVKRKYIPSNDELTGRKSKIIGTLLPPIKVDMDTYAMLQEKARSAGLSLNEIRKRAYKNLINENDTILSDILED